MSEADAKALIHQVSVSGFWKTNRVRDLLNILFQADKDANKDIDFSKFASLWEAIHGDGEVFIFIRKIITQKAEIRKQFSFLDSGNSRFITKG